MFPRQFDHAVRALALAILLSACANEGKPGKPGTSCSMTQADDGSVTVSCGDGSTATLHPPSPFTTDAGNPQACSFTRGATSVAIQCPDGSSATIPTGPAPSDAGSPTDAGGLDAATGQACQVDELTDGSITINCPDGTTATLPAEPAQPTTSARLLGATAASCGTCHDAASARAHFKVMTFEGDGGPRETCGTCHSESGVQPVSRSHQRPELGLPGLLVQIEDARIDPAARTVTTQLALKDKTGTALTRDGVSFSFLIASVGSVTSIDGTASVAGPYENYLVRSVTQKDNADYPLGSATARTVLQPATEAGTGTFSEIHPGSGDGRYAYTFSYLLPAGYDGSRTHLVALYATRTVGETRFVANATRFFVPNDAGETPITRDVVRTETCNTCHNTLSAHGGARQEVQLCLGCHSQGAVDPESGNSLDFNVMVHRIHRGKQLPSVQAGTPYSIVGYGNHTVDWSEVGYPQPIENCQSCHTSSDSERWVTNGSRAVCTSCHETIDRPWAEGGHPFALEPTATCSNGNCHGVGGKVRDAREAHLTFLNDGRATLFQLDILSVSAPSADAPVSVRIQARVGRRNPLAAALRPVTTTSQLAALEVFINGPNTGYLWSGNTLKHYAKAALSELTLDPARPGEFTFTLPESLRATVGSLGDPSLDSFTLSLGAVYDPTPGATPDDDRTSALVNPTRAFSASGTVVARREVVTTERCNTCHGDLQQHSGALQAKNVEQCVMCHTASFDTRVRQGVNQVAGPTQSLRLSTLVHRIHGTAIATVPYVVYGDAPSLPAGPYPVVDYSQVPFPGDVRDCTSCHLPGTYFLPLPANEPPTQTAILAPDGSVLAP